MANQFDSLFGVSASALPIREARQKLLAGNLANADTPNYKAKDLDFKAALLKLKGDDDSLPSPSTNLTHRNHIAGFNDAMDTNAYLRFRMPTQPSLDGNTVETHIEKAKFMENNMQQSMTLQFLDSKIKGMREAIRGS
jgi:flagellar basal-body rod protein FlgB